MTALYAHPMQEDVAIFHRAFGLPDRIVTPGALPADRIDLRLALIREKGIVELQGAILDVQSGKADSPVEIIDAFIDTIYVALGTLVEMGQPVNGKLPYAAPLFAGPRGLVGNADATRLYIVRALAHLEIALDEGDVAQSVEALSKIAVHSYVALAYSNIDPQPYFNEVQRANMSKLGADGKPIHSRGNSVPDLRKVYLEQTAAQEA